MKGNSAGTQAFESPLDFNRKAFLNFNSGKLFLTPKTIQEKPYEECNIKGSKMPNRFFESFRSDQISKRISLSRS